MQKALLSAFLCFAMTMAYGQTDTIHVLNDFEVGYRYPAQGVSRRTDGSISISSAALRRGMHILGETDAIAASSMLPGIGASGDYASGISVNGSDFTHTVYSLDGATVFFPYRFGGILSDFNPNHVVGLSITTAHFPSSPYFLGASYDGISYYNSSSVPDRVRGSANVGVLATSLAVEAPIDDNTSVKASGRVSYLNMLYDRLLTDGDNEVRYRFNDFNVSMIHRFNGRKTIKVGGFHSYDNLSFDDAGFMLGTRLGWRNMGASAVYTVSTDRCDYRQTVAWSALRSRLSLDMSQFALAMPSSVSQVTVNGDATLRHQPLSIGYRLEYNHFAPQQPVSTGIVNVESAARCYESWLASVGVAHTFAIDSMSCIKAALRLVGYKSDDYHNISANPEITYAYGDFTAVLAYATQYMHQVGFSDIGLASNFFVPALKALPPQQQLGMELRYRWRLPMFDVDVNAFAKTVYDAPEYTGNVLALLGDRYDPLASVVTADGYNVGGNITAYYDMGAFSGWLGYGYALCRRKFADAPDEWVPAANIPLNSLKAMAAYKVTDRLCLSAYFTLASGRPYTPVNAIFMVSGNVLTEYGRRNSARLPAYHRLDISATYDLSPLRFRGLKIRHFLNFSLLNAYGHDNIEMQYYKYDNDNSILRLRQVRSIMHFLPSVSYTLQY